MSLFARNIQGSQGFHPLFRLLDDFDKYSTQGNNGSTRAPLSFQPKFDVREFEDAYELHGELAGVTKDNVNIEFTDPQTLHIHGRIERTYTSGTPPAGLLGDAEKSSDVADDAASTSSHSHKATVEDEDAEDNAASTQVQEKKPAESPAPATNSAKYWISERSIGQFSRNFNFPVPVQQDNVTAGLKDGVLTVRIPKTPKHESRRRIQVN